MCHGMVRDVVDRRRLRAYLEKLQGLSGERAREMLERIAAAKDLKTGWKIEILSQAVRRLSDSPSDDAVEQCLSALLRDYAFQCSTSYPEGKSASRILTIETFFNYYVDRSRYQSVEHLINIIQEGNFPLSHLRGPISSGTGLVFFTETDAIPSSTAISYILGSEILLEAEEYIELVFDPFNPDELSVFVPTTADALAHPNFRPSRSGATKGRTLNLHTGRVEDGAPEYVTRHFSPQRVKKVVYHGPRTGQRQNAGGAG